MTDPALSTERGNATEPARWVDEHGDALFRFAMMRVRDRNVAEELVQETFLAALGSAEKFRSDSAERTWMLAILKRKVVDHYRRLSRGGGVAEIDEIGSILEHEFKQDGLWRIGPARWPVDPEKALEDREFRKALDDCLAKMQPRTARAFVLREMDDLTSDEICNVLGVSPTNLWVILHRARLSLRLCIERSWFGDRRRRH